MKKVLSVLLTLMLVATTLPMSIALADEIVASESLTQQDGFYLINNAADLKKANDMVNVDGMTDASFQVTANIDYQNNEWLPLAAKSSYTGRFFGGNHVIKNLKITQIHGLGDCGYGFFARTGGSCYIAGLGIENMNIELMPTASDAMRVGGFVGLGGGTITGCYVKNSSIRVLNENLYGLGTGVFAGVTVSGGNVNNCYAYNSVLCGQGSVGCFSGRPESGSNSCTNCYVADITIDTTGATSKVNAPSNIARFACEMNNGATVNNCYSNYKLCTRTDFVKTVSTKDEIVAGIGASFTADDSVNNGYPCFSWELWDGQASESLTQQDGVYLINNAADLKKAAEMVNSGDEAYKAASYKLTADINYMNCEWTPIGLNGFTGKFDGNYHIVKNLKITTNNSFNAFFGDVKAGAVISNLGVENLTMNLNGGNWTGGYASRCYGTFTNCYIANSTIKNTGGWAMGAFVGAIANAATFTNCYVYDVTLNGGKGTYSGFAGTSEGYGYLNNCFVGNITTDGTTLYNLCNGNNKSITVSSCYSNMQDSGVSTSKPATYSADKATLVAGLGTAYTTDASINDGYPCFGWQIWTGEAASALKMEDGVYQINNAADLKKAAEIANTAEGATAQYELTADINYLNYEWSPIGKDTAFAGKFNGNGHVIKNAKMTQNYTVNGFFGDVAASAEISNLGLENLTMNMNGGYWCGAFACRSYGKFTNCYVANSSLTNASAWALGGFVGASANSGTYTNCYVYNVALNGHGAPSGFCKVEGYSYFTNCYVVDITTTAGSLYNLTYNPSGHPVSTSNCCSNMENTNSGSTPVVAALVDKDTMVRNYVTFDENSIFKVNSKINNGYPSFTYQKAASYDKAYEVTLVDTVDGATKIRLETNEVVDGAKVYVATYEDSGRLIAAETLDPATIMTSKLTGDNLKVFVWDAENYVLAKAYVK